MQEVYPAAKEEFPGLPSKDLISLVARRWKDLEIDGRTTWKERANQATDNREASGRTSTNSNKDDNQIDTAASGTNCLHQFSKEDDNVEVREIGDKHKDEINTGQGTISKPDLEESR